MPVVVNCKKCGKVIAKWNELPGSSACGNWYAKLRLELRGKCPHCGHTLPSVEAFLHKMKLVIKPATRHCPDCDEDVVPRSDRVGKGYHCPNCKASLGYAGAWKNSELRR